MRQDAAQLEQWLHLDIHSGVPLYLQLKESLERAIDLGQLHPGDALPPVRTLASVLRIAPNTIVRAYAALQAAGRIESRAGAGTTVTARPATPTPVAQQELLLREFQLVATRLLRSGIHPDTLHRTIHELASHSQEVLS